MRLNLSFTESERDGAGAGEPPALQGSRRVRFHPDTRAHEVAVAEDVVDAADGGPEFVVVQPWRGVGGLGAGVGAVPVVCGEHVGCVWRVFEEVVGFVSGAGFDGYNLGVDGDHGVAEAVEFFL